MDTEPLAFPALTTMLKAAGEATRLRILALIAEAELTVSDLTDILRQSQPRLSRHLRLLAEAGPVEGFREGSWGFFLLGLGGGVPVGALRGGSGGFFRSGGARGPRRSGAHRDRAAQSRRCDRRSRSRA